MFLKTIEEEEATGRIRRALSSTEGPESLRDVRDAVLDCSRRSLAHLSGILRQDPGRVLTEPARLAPDHIDCGQTRAIHLLLLCLWQAAHRRLRVEGSGSGRATRARWMFRFVRLPEHKGLAG